MAQVNPQEQAVNSAEDQEFLLHFLFEFTFQIFSGASQQNQSRTIPTCGHQLSDERTAHESSLIHVEKV